MIIPVCNILFLVYSDPPLGIQGLCSVVVWYRPEVPCRDIHGYEVRLYHPQSEHLNLTNRVGVNATHYIVDEDKLVSRDETVVQVFFHMHVISELCTIVQNSCMQVRVVYSSGAGKWSEGTSLGKAGSYYVVHWYPLLYMSTISYFIPYSRM